MRAEYRAALNNEALAYAQKLSNSVSIAQSLHHVSRSYALRGNMRMANEYANKTLKLAIEQHFSLFSVILNWWMALSLALMEGNKPIIKEVHEANDTLTTKMADHIGLSYRLSFLAEIY
jgi:hypothetical protein